MRRIEMMAFAAAAFALATPAVAQGRGKGKASQRNTSAVQRGTDGIYRTSRTSSGTDRVPPGHLPPAGMCRVWIDGVPPGHQPPVTDCATAQAQRTGNSRVVYGDDTPFPGQGRRSASSGRQCVERRDVYGNLRYECENDRSDRRNGTYDPIGVLTGRSDVYDRDDTDYRYQNDVRGAGNAEKIRQKGRKAKKGKGD